MPTDLCKKCSKYECESFDPINSDDEGYVSPYCIYCNDREIESSNERREWNYYHNEK